MRIRQVRPEFFSDPVVSRLSPEARLTYIGLWCIADDAGYLSWDLASIATQIYPYQSVQVRERLVMKAADALVTAGRIIPFECGCALIPRLEDHQRIGGNKSFTARDRHESRHVRTNPPVGSNGSEVVKARERATNDDEKVAIMASYRRQGLPVDVS